MTSAAILGPLSALHEMLLKLVESVPEPDAQSQFHPELGSLHWYLGRSVYQELYWLREVLGSDNDLSSRVEEFFQPGRASLAEQCAHLPPRHHLMSWATEVMDEHLMRLANPGLLPEHPLLVEDRLSWFLLQEVARNYESMLTVLVQRRLQMGTPDYRVETPLLASPPTANAREIHQGHYRIGARNDPAAYDNELPPQAVELSSFRIATRPVSNAEFLAFMESGAYGDQALWSEDGWDWLQSLNGSHPDHWRRDSAGNWCGVGVQGPGDLPADQPVTGINRHEAGAYANWVSARGQETAGAVLAHEYQWELAARTGAIELVGRAWEWCSNRFHP